MIRKAFLIQSRPGMAAEYQRRHNPVWPDLEKILKSYGVNNYSIFLQKDTGALFGYLEVEDEKKYELIAEEEVCKQWWRYMTEVLVCENDESPKAKEVILAEVFHLD